MTTSNSQLITIALPEDFMERLAGHIHEQYIKPGKDLKRLAVVFGGGRPALFLKRALAKRVGSAFYPPEFLTIDQFIQLLTPKHAQLVELDHCFVMYQLALKHAPSILKGREDFARFLPWAREILHFIEQLDLENAPADALKVLKEHATIGFDVPEDINRLLASLMILRVQYHRYLHDHQLTARGYQYLKAKGAIGQCPLDDFDHIIFGNFFYLHRTEMGIIKDLFDRGKATLFMQGDQRKWPALKRIADQLGQPVFEGKQIAPRAFELKVYEAFDMQSQAALVGKILEGIVDLDKTVIVLPDADFMLVLLSSLGPYLKDFNISLGYPLKRSSMHALLELVVQSQKTMKGPLYYTRDYVRLLRHPLVKSDILVRTLAHKLEEVLTGVISSQLSGTVFLKLEDILSDEVIFQETLNALKVMDIATSIEQLKQLMKETHQHFFAQWQKLSTFKDLSGAMDKFGAFLDSKSHSQPYPFNAQVYSRLFEISSAWGASQLSQQPFDKDDLLRIMLEQLSRECIAFSGSPLKGLQVLGLLETRSLSFEHVIVVDVNERVLPNLNIYEPLIPREVMIKLNCDRLELEEEIQRYHFMRMVSGAKKVHLIYQQRADKQRSRLIEELVWEQEQAKKEIGVVDIVRPAFAVGLSHSPKSIAKTSEVINFLKSFTFSATSINTYKRNPYEFYLNYVLGLRDKEDLLDDPDGRHVGIFIHGLLEDAFKPLIGQKPLMDANFRKRFMQNFETRFYERFGKGLKSDAFLMKVVMQNRLERFLQVESQRIESEVEELLLIERKFMDVIDLPCGSVRFSYRVDRVERLTDKTILILDYKTGSSDQASVQMPLYLYYLDKQYPQAPVNAAIYHLRTMTMEPFLKANASRPRQEIIAGFLKDLDVVVSEIFNPEIPFIDNTIDIE